MASGKVSSAREFIFGGYQNQCVGFSIGIEISDERGGTFFHGSEAFYTKPENIEAVRKALQQILAAYNVSSLQDLIGKNVFYTEENGKFFLTF